MKFSTLLFTAVVAVSSVVVVLADQIALEEEESVLPKVELPGLGAIQCNDEEKGISDGIDCPSAYDLLANTQCDAESVERTDDVECNKTPFKGSYHCREYMSFFFLKSRHSVCVRDVTEGVTLGMKGDECGCCDGPCKVCTCECSEGSKLIQSQWLFGLFKPKHCVPNGYASHLTNWGGRANCVPDEECDAALIEMGYLDPTDAPTISPAPSAAP